MSPSHASSSSQVAPASHAEARSSLEVEMATASARLEGASPEERLRFALDRFGDGLIFTSSFGAGSGVLLHLWSQVAKTRPVIMIDTGFLFAETHAYKDTLVELLGLNVEFLRPEIPRGPFLAAHGDDIMKRDSDFCCAQNKIAPLAPVRARATGWVSGLRRDQSAVRASTPILLVEDDGPVKVHPLATMTAAEAEAYMQRHGIPEHPLKARRFLSIGCEPCTRAVADGEDERAGRWAGSQKTECGIHSPNRPKKA